MKRKLIAIASALTLAASGLLIATPVQAAGNTYSFTMAAEKKSQTKVTYSVKGYGTFTLKAGQSKTIKLRNTKTVTVDARFDGKSCKYNISSKQYKGNRIVSSFVGTQHYHRAKNTTLLNKDITKATLSYKTYDCKK